MNIKQKHEESHGLFYVEEADKPRAQINYIKPGTKSIVITNTDIDKAWQGQHVGQQLVEAAVDYARQNQLTLRSFCPYAEYLLEHEQQYQDVFRKAA